MGIKSQALGISKERLPFGKRPNKGSFGKKRTAIKPKRIATDEELKYLKWIKSQDLECFVCGSSNVVLHHIKEKSTDKKNHKRLLPLCINHHTGEVFSPHGTPILWRKQYTIGRQNRVADEIYKRYEREIEC